MAANATGGFPDYAAAIEGFTRGFIREREAADTRKARTGQVLFEAAKTNPDMFDDPTASKAIEAYIGDKDAFDLVRTMYQSQAGPEKIAHQQASALGLVTPEEQAQVAQIEQQAAQARAANRATPTESPMAGLARGLIGSVPLVGPPIAQAVVPPPPVPTPQPVPNPYAGARERLAQRAPTRAGVSTTMTAKGGTSVNVTGPTRGEAGALNFYQAVESRRTELEAGGMSGTAAHLRALRDATEFADANGFLVPKEARKLSEAKTQQQVAAALARVTKAAEREVEKATAAGIEYEKEAGQRGARVDQPMNEQERATRRASDMSRKLNLTPEQELKLTEEYIREEKGAVAETEAFGREKGAARGRLATGAPQPTPAEARTRLTGAQGSIDALGEVQELFDPKVIGPLQGRVTNMKAMIGALKIPEARFNAAVDRFIRAERLATTGQQASADELKRMKQELLNINMAPPQFYANVVELARGSQATHQRLSEILKANNEVTIPLEIAPGLQAWLAAVEQAPPVPQETAQPPQGAPQLPAGWKLEQVQ